MNRMEEYEALMQELEQPVPGLAQTLDRAMTKNARRKRFTRPAAGFAAAFACFVLLVNFCASVSYACSKVPILRELAEAVTFSRSLTDAVDHRYVQPLHLWQKDGDVVATVEYLIVDQKQVNVFYRLDSDVYDPLSETPTVLKADGSHPASCSYGLNDCDVPNGKLRSMTIDFIDGDVPDTLRLKLSVESREAQAEAIVPETYSPEDDLLSEAAEHDPDYVAQFDFLLEFDPEYTAAGKTIELNRTLELDGQQITFTTIEIYPTHLRLNISDDPGNTAWMKRLDFYVQTDWGMKFDPIENGITATGTTDSPMMTSYRADSTYFYDARHLKIVITGAEWLEKNMERIHLNLKTGESDPLPDGTALDHTEQKENGWLLTFRIRQRAENHTHQAFTSAYYDADGKEYWRESWSTMFDWENREEDADYFLETYPLRDYPYDEVWLCPEYTNEWTAKTPVIMEIQ